VLTPVINNHGVTNLYLIPALLDTIRSTFFLAEAMLVLRVSMESARLLARLFFAIGFFSYGAQAQDLSASDILNKIAESYQRISNFSVVAEKKVDLDTDTSGRKYVAANADAGNTEVVYVGSHQSEYIQVRLLLSSSSKAKLLLKDGKKGIVAVNDGNVVWTLIPAQHAYTEMIARNAIRTSLESHDISGANLIQDYKSLLATRFLILPSYASWAKLENLETLKVGKDRKECYVLTIQKQGSSEKQKLWVDKAGFTIWKSVDVSRSPMDFWGDVVQTTVTVTTKQMDRNPSLDDSNFVFTVPEEARKVDVLKLSGENPF
jgi:outer membrane lipoprotein-sorting protein